jgi:hypothetical protein
LPIKGIKILSTGRLFYRQGYYLKKKLMQSEIRYRRVILRECSVEDKDYMELYGIFRATLKPDISFREFKAYYQSSRLEYIDITFILAQGRVVGFCSAAFYTGMVGERMTVIGRAATGILEEYRGRTLPKWKLYWKYIAYWRRHPLRTILLSAYVANPLIYAMICKYTGIAYPHPLAPAPAAIVKLKNALMRQQRPGVPAEDGFVMPIHFSVAIGKKEQERIRASRDPAIGFFVQINPRFLQQYGVLVIIPIGLRNILWSSWKFVYHKLIRRGRAEFAGGERLGDGEVNFN